MLNYYLALAEVRCDTFELQKAMQDFLKHDWHEDDDNVEEILDALKEFAPPEMSISNYSTCIRTVVNCLNILAFTNLEFENIPKKELNALKDRLIDRILLQQLQHRMKMKKHLS